MASFVGQSYRTTEFTNQTVPVDLPIDGFRTYFLMARANRDVGKASLDLVLDRE